MLTYLRPAAVMTLAFTLLLGVAYPLAITGLAHIAMPYQAAGSLVAGPNGGYVGSALIAQSFSKPGYLHPRGSAAGAGGYDATSSSGSNLGPMDPKLATNVRSATIAFQRENPSARADAARIPADAVTQSGSGLDPDVSPQNALLQAPRIAAARGLAPAQITAVIEQHTSLSLFGFIGQPRVNVLAVNRALDAQSPRKVR